MKRKSSLHPLSCSSLFCLALLLHLSVTLEFSVSLSSFCGECLLVGFLFQSVRLEKSGSRMINTKTAGGVCCGGPRSRRGAKAGVSTLTIYLTLVRSLGLISRRAVLPAHPQLPLAFLRLRLTNLCVIDRESFF
ncbi:hypothetical protein QQF64_031196 [Cirrhinus molitorella]|uniref:Secreted protein n=1 Tax=Cirrhinus molitorella TaxID=172907 RepID=A0ABR3MW98_9TELE